MKNKKLVGLGNKVVIFLQGISIVGVFILLFLYPITKTLKIHFDLFIIMVYPCGILFLLIINEFIKLFNTLKDGNPFCIENVKRFKNNMKYSIIISILILIALLISIFVYNYYGLQLKMALVFISFLFFCCSVCFYVLSELFRQATEYKEENDLTI